MPSVYYKSTNDKCKKEFKVEKMPADVLLDQLSG